MDARNGQPRSPVGVPLCYKDTDVRTPVLAYLCEVLLKRLRLRQSRCRGCHSAPYFEERLAVRSGPYL